MFDDLSVPYKAVELDEHENGEEIQKTLKDISGQNTVPNVFIKGTHLGGSDDTQVASQSGRLQELLNKDVWAKQPGL